MLCFLGIFVYMFIGHELVLGRGVFFFCHISRNTHNEYDVWRTTCVQELLRPIEYSTLMSERMPIAHIFMNLTKRALKLCFTACGCWRINNTCDFFQQHEMNFIVAFSSHIYGYRRVFVY